MNRPSISKGVHKGKIILTELERMIKGMTAVVRSTVLTTNTIITALTNITVRFSPTVLGISHSTDRRLKANNLCFFQQDHYDSSFNRWQCSTKAGSLLNITGSSQSSMIVSLSMISWNSSRLNLVRVSGISPECSMAREQISFFRQQSYHQSNRIGLHQYAS
jgi:hypothetical protein